MTPDCFNILVARAANEGIPVAAIARILQRPFAEISESLRSALAYGQIGQMPKPDWPPDAKWTGRLPTVPRALNAADIEFDVKKRFRLTRLEAGFTVVLLTHDCVDKAQLHGVIERQRRSRQVRLDNQEATNPKMVDVMICKLRKKLKAVEETLVIQTNWGQGYFFEPDTKQRIFALVGVQDASGPQTQ